MKARWIILGAVLLAFVVSPTAMPAMAHGLSVSPCRIAKSQSPASQARHRRQAMRAVAFSLPGHRPATRLHRIRGKRLSIEQGLLKAQRSSAPSWYVFPVSQARLQDADGPNPSRGPPARVL